MLLSQAHHLLDLGQDLSLTEDKAVETGSDPHQMVNSALVVIAEQMGGQLSRIQPGMATEKVTDSTDPEFRVADQGVDLKPVAGAED